MPNVPEGLSATVHALDGLSLQGANLCNVRWENSAPRENPQQGILPQGTGLEMFRSLLGGSQLSPCPPKGTAVLNEAFQLILQGPGAPRCASS